MKLCGRQRRVVTPLRRVECRDFGIQASHSRFWYSTGVQTFVREVSAAVQASARSNEQGSQTDPAPSGLGGEPVTAGEAQSKVAGKRVVRKLIEGEDQSPSWSESSPVSPVPRESVC